MVNIEEQYDGLTRRLGPALEKAEMPGSEPAYLERRLPPRLIRFLMETGQAIYLDGAVTVCKPSDLTPILALIFKGDKELNHKDCTVVSYGAFGELSVWSNKHHLIDINLAEGLIFSQALAPTHFMEGLVPEPKEPPNPEMVASYAIVSKKRRVDFLDFKGEEMFDRCIAAHGTLSLGECYGFFPALGLTDPEGPMRRVENIRKVPALEHFAILAQLQPFYLANVGPNGIQKVREIG